MQSSQDSWNTGNKDITRSVRAENGNTTSEQFLKVQATRNTVLCVTGSVKSSRHTHVTRFTLTCYCTYRLIWHSTNT